MNKALFISVLLALVAGALLGWLYYDARKHLAAPLAVQAPSTLVVTPGMSLRAVAHQLAARGWFDYPLYLQLEGRRRGVAGAIQAGEYRVEPGMTALALLRKMVAGAVVQHALTLPEGWTLRQIIAALQENPLVENTLESTAPRRVMEDLGYPGYYAEGRFFPDTYYFPAGESDVEILRRAFARMETVLQEEWRQRDLGLPYRSPYEALILASLVEKETAVSEERGEIAGVFVRRLGKNMKLQADPTVIYALGTDYDGDIKSAHLKADSPFNTYRYKGLPPTPIASPGRASIRAALQPKPGASLYFVATGAGGRHHFSKTLAEHNRAVAKYQGGAKK